MLLILARAIQNKIAEVNRSPPRLSLPPVNFVKAGASVSKTPVTAPPFGVLEKARDWICDFDLPEFHAINPVLFSRTLSVLHLYGLMVISFLCPLSVVLPDRS